MRWALAALLAVSSGLRAGCTVTLHRCNWGGGSSRDITDSFPNYEECAKKRATFQKGCVNDSISPCQCDDASGGQASGQQATGQDAINQGMTQAVTGMLQGKVSVGDAATVVGAGALATGLMNLFNSQAQSQQEAPRPQPEARAETPQERAARLEREAEAARQWEEQRQEQERQRKVQLAAMAEKFKKEYKPMQDELEGQDKEFCRHKPLRPLESIYREQGVDEMRWDDYRARLRAFCSRCACAEGEAEVPEKMPQAPDPNPASMPSQDAADCGAGLLSGAGEQGDHHCCPQGFPYYCGGRCWAEAMFNRGKVPCQTTIRCQPQ